MTALTKADRVHHPLEAVGVSKSYPGRGGIVPVTEAIDLSFPEGSFTSIVGRSGCGKTTLLKMLAGLVEPTTGEVRYGLDDGYVRPPIPRGRLGMVFQTPALLKWRSTLDNVLLPIEVLAGTPSASDVDRARELLGLVGLGGAEDRMPHELSGGMQQRVSIARALISDPKVLLMDEPFGALDALTRHDIRFELLRIWAATRKTIVFVTHDVEEAVMLSDRVVVLTPRPAAIDVVVDVPIERPRTTHYRADPGFASTVEALEARLHDRGATG